MCTWQDDPTSSIVHFAMNVVALSFLRRDLLDAVLEDKVTVGRDERFVVGDVHLVLAAPRLALGGFDRDAGGAHLVSDAAQDVLLA